MIKIPIAKRPVRNTKLEGWTSVMMRREDHEKLKELSAKSGMSMRKIMGLLIANAKVAK